MDRYEFSFTLCQPDECVQFVGDEHHQHVVVSGANDFAEAAISALAAVQSQLCPDPWVTNVSIGRAKSGQDSLWNQSR